MKSRRPDPKGPRTPKPGKNPTLRITSINDFGFGVGKAGGQVLMVPRTVVGDLVEVTQPRTSDYWSSADLVKVLESGPDRVPSPCRAFDQGCGGCSWLGMAYPAQVRWKEKNLAAVLRARGGYTGRVEPFIPMAQPWGYRNKLSLKNHQGTWRFLTEVQGQPVTPETCAVQTPALQKAWEILKVQAPPGALDQLHLRSNDAGEVGLHGFLFRGKTLSAETIKNLVGRIPGAVGLGLTQDGRYSQVWGQEVLIQAQGSLQWLIPHNGFYQTNAPMIPVLVDQVRRWLPLSPRDTLLDLYCGGGFFSLALGSSAGRCLGLELNPESVAMARASAQASGLPNLEFRSGKVEELLQQIPPAPREAVLLDPPREGLHPEALGSLRARRASRILYISCHPVSLARDLKALTAGGYRVQKIGGLDMFPHTSHLETLALLDLGK